MTRGSAPSTAVPEASGIWTFGVLGRTVSFFSAWEVLDFFVEPDDALAEEQEARISAGHRTAKMPHSRWNIRL